MATELAYAMITPYSLHKSRTGGIIGRLVSLSQLDLVGIHMYAPGDSWVDAYVDILSRSDLEDPVRGAFIDYVDENLRRDNPLGLSNRCMILLFEGENAFRHLMDDVVGRASPRVTGHTVRGTYGDFQKMPDGTIPFFAATAATDGGVISSAVDFLPGSETFETQLVILKPENFERRSRRPGYIIDVFSRTGLYIVGAKLLSMSAAQGEAFYGPLLEVFRDKLQFLVENTMRERLKGAFDFPLPQEFLPTRCSPT
ncbi:MAG: hypothetical protein AMK72_13165 [Planctomycetes bacterium SM23_25]|nr:MAG: hypothetical protein AMK72_13165 [Planctomycetes bacterium SM23_25]